MKVKAYCEGCDKMVEIDEMQIAKTGNVYLFASCEHFIGYAFMGTIHLKMMKKKEDS